MRTREAIERDSDGADAVELLHLLKELMLDVREALVELIELVAAEPEA